MNQHLSDTHELHQAIDRQVHPLTILHQDRLQCRRGCASCCVDDLTVFEIEADWIRQNHADLLANQQPHPTGACAFLDQDQACRIYASRPYVCRTQGLPLRWFDESPDDEDELLEYRDICPLNDGEPPIEELPADACWTIGPVEQSLADAQLRQKSNLNRVPLRSLFQHK